MHVDGERAARSPFGGTVAHGFLTPSLFSPMLQTAMSMDIGMRANYGVRAGS